MARISGVNIPTNKKVNVALTYIFGIGPKRASEICSKASVDQTKRVNELKEDEVTKIRELIENNFTQSDFVTDPGQFSVRGGIVDVFSYADEYPFRIEFFDDQIESIRTFNINSQLSVEQKEKISIIPNTEAKKVIEKKVSFLEYLPKNSTIWIEDILYTKGILQQNFKKGEEELKKFIDKSSIHNIDGVFIVEPENILLFNLLPFFIRKSLGIGHLGV